MNRAASLAVGLLVVGWVARGVAAQDFSGQQPDLPGPGGGSGSSIPSLPSSGASTGPSLPVGMKYSVDATSFQPQISAFIQQQVDKIVDNNSDDQRTARELLIRECTPGSTVSFLNIYSAEVNTAVMAVLNKPAPAPLRVRLNLAVLVESVAHLARDPSLKPAVGKLVSDPAEPVALWGVRAARSLLVPVALLNATTADPLVAQVVASVKAHVKFGFLAEEAYRTLSLEGEGVTLATLPNTLTNCVQAILDVVNFRVSIYQKSVADDPEAENVAARFFAASYDKGLNTPEQQKIVQALTNLVTVVGAQSAGASHAVLEQLVGCLRLAAQSLSVITKEPPGTPLERVMHLVAGTGGAPITQQTGAVFAELQPRFPFLQPAPAVTPTSRPATQRRSSTPTPPPAPAAAAAAG